jgi:putative effector of murein hydrolase LrgA (UPF0299 family)
MTIKTFWIENKNNYLWSCLALFLLCSFIGLIKVYDMTTVIFFTLAGFILMFFMSWGIYEFTDRRENEIK